MTPRPDPAEVPADTGADPDTGTTDKRILANTAVMAAGTLVSRFSGFFRSTLLAAALGLGLHADVFNVANTVPNMLYILLAGGVFNAVLVPQLVRAMKNDADGGAAYVDRIMTLAICFLGVVTILLVAAAPWVMELVLSSKFNDPANAEVKQSAIDFARYCLPQVFFYGMFVLVGQVLNARGRFGPMMWAPIANNVIAVAVLAVYLFVFGPASAAEQQGPFSTGEELLLGVGSTLGIVAQFVILVPYLRSAGIRFRPRFDFRGSGLGHTLRLGVWTVLFVIVNQMAYVVVVRLASGGTAAAEDGTGITIYSSTMLVVMVPHSIITVSLATAILPRLSAFAANGETRRLATTLGSTLRTALVVVVPIAALLPSVAEPVARIVWGYGAAAGQTARFEEPMMLFGLGVVAFTVHYMVLRGFYALERNRTVFFIQCVIAATNIVLAIVLVGQVGPERTASALILAYTGSYAVGAIVSASVLRRTLLRASADDPTSAGATEGGLSRWSGWLPRLAAATAAVYVVGALVDIVVTDTLAELDIAPHLVTSVLEAASVGLAGAVTLVAAAGALHLREVTSVVGTVTRRLSRR